MKDSRLENEELIAFAHETIRPLIEADGGSFEVSHIAGNEVTVRLGKACVGCPGVYYTKEHVIRALLEHALGTSVQLHVVWETLAP